MDGKTVERIESLLEELWEIREDAKKARDSGVEYLLSLLSDDERLKAVAFLSDAGTRAVALEERAEKIELKIKALSETAPGTSVVTRWLTVKAYPGDVKWNSEMLKGLALAYPALNAAQIPPTPFSRITRTSGKDLLALSRVSDHPQASEVGEQDGA